MTNDLFNVVAMPNIPSNVFNLSHEVKLSFEIGELVPTCVVDCLPGDVFRFSPEIMLRFAPLVAPVMHRVYADTHYYFVPYRLLWSGFEDFITGNSDAAAPYVEFTADELYGIGTIADYLGFPAGEASAGTIRFSPFYFAAYRLIYDEYYRDQNLEVSELFVPLVAGDNSSEYGVGSLIENGNPQVRALLHDYFTSALPFAQKGDPVQLPLTFQAGIPVELSGSYPGPAGKFVDVLAGNPVSGAVSADATTGLLNVGGSTNSQYDPNGTLVVDIQSDAVNLETLRTAIVLQEFLERDARSGTRYTEKIQGQYGVRSSDARLQRPEYLGGVRQIFAISEVLATAQTLDGTGSEILQYVGQMAGHGISVGGGQFSFRCEEFGCVIGITSVLPEPAYQQGLHRSWRKFDAINDFAWPAFANLGEQEVENSEVFFANPAPAGTFGYQARYAEYKSMYSRVAGEFRDTLDFWHLGVIFADGSNPPLNNEFIKALPAKFNRIFAVTDAGVDHIYARVVNQITAARKLPRFGIPSFGSTNMG